ncbi:cardiolipin synthase [Corynebacterium sp. 153RC1]|uniref:cardiolipin synthase n=1 Tax=unclassified Corynebacterium TaxID=2624378 RepID=UPI00211C92E2|nr:cardiolipin synthase [Corynebacterium sp. 209RC1]MCQ9354702.1 cardiolipin synthase [Corynebacterium sp. 1222RC1]MCQ9356813.1 cardiolipin synthase [Corynebacterium sp. 122RC1]MCQ9358983.1 cardiolipin synthase [Corynebacterium sp. 142RC1]MCQ9361281.1 cardiolipin synthase [Corynebacterium sp. 153RC1]MCQ9363489.1 cardiolipin synthase [Corynebacterium sp. 732RC1]MCQ9365114.1 cardiolipin synthase [Corynebacterium sp. 70RC1]MCQ9370982.1 cardiolipin synthase [Corynebacterium sp. 35RC1]
MTVDLSSWQAIGLIIDYTIKIAAIGFVPEGRRPSSSTAWLLAILLLPFVGLPLFLLMGSPWINRRRHRIQDEANQRIKELGVDVPDSVAMSEEIDSIIRLNRNLTGMPAVSGETHGYYPDYKESIERMAQVVDGATKYVHVEIYIVSWDDTTDVFFQALARAVKRGVKVRLLFDQVGSWKYKGYLKLGRRLTEIGVDWQLMLPLKPWRRRFRRPDLRNHRKMVIVDGKRGFIGSQNMIEPSYGNKGRNWVDVMFEFSGPIVTSMNLVFAVDWLLESGETVPFELSEVHGEDLLQLVPSGPGYHAEPNLRMFNSVIHHAKERLVMCSPYFIPDESMMEAVTSACFRGVKVELLVSEQADQFVVNHAQTSYYQALLEAGVKIHRYKKPAVLHSKFLLADEIGVLGSSNMDMRSFGLNYEVTLMATHKKVIAQLEELAQGYKENSIELTLEEWNERSFGRRYLDNVMRLTSALQ